MNSAHGASLAAEPAAVEQSKQLSTHNPKSSHAKSTITVDAPTRITRDQIKELFLHELSHTERLLAILWYVERMSPEEIAAAMDSTPDDVELHHARIIQKLG